MLSKLNSLLAQNNNEKIEVMKEYNSERDKD